MKNLILIKFVLPQIWVILRMGALSVSSVCLIWVISKIESPNWCSYVIAGIIVIVMSVYMFQLLQEGIRRNIIYQQAMKIFSNKKIAKEKNV